MQRRKFGWGAGKLEDRIGIHPGSHRIAKKVIVAKGNNDFLGNGEGIHVGVRKDFRPTENGMVRIDGWENYRSPPPADPTMDN